jgi:hypothetical protein
MKFLIAFLVTVVSATPVNAAEIKLDEQAIKALLSDATLISSGDSRPTEQVFRASGLTFTIDIETQVQSLGSWRVENDKYCSIWPPSEHWSCYKVFRTNEGVVFVSSNGTRYEMRQP